MTNKDVETGKVEIKIGSVCFSAEGPQDWLSEQLTKVIEAASNSGGTLAGSSIQESASFSVPEQKIEPKLESSSMSLVSYLKAKGADSSQNMRFLATAGWLRQRGQKEITTSEVSQTLAAQHQKRLTNASDCLNKNVAKGLCEKKGKLFFITPEGLKMLGEGHEAG